MNLTFFLCEEFMKLFQRLLVAPAALGLLSPLAANASDVDFQAISNYSIEEIEVDSNTFKLKSDKSLLLSGGEGLVDDHSHDGGFSETTTASFGVDMAIGAVDGPGTSAEAVKFAYSAGIGLETSFTGEDSLSMTIDIGNAVAGDLVAGTSGLNYNATEDKLALDGLTYSFPLGGATIMVGDNTDASATFSGACAYSAFTDYMGNCGTGYSAPGAKGVTAAMSYAFDNGVSFAAGISSTESAILTKEGDDAYAAELAYTADNYGIAVAYAMSETTPTGGTQAEYTAWGLNGYYAFDAFTVSAGVESKDPETTATEEGYFIGLTWDEFGPGSLSLGMSTLENYTDAQTELYQYEAAYSYPINDGMTITPGVFIKEGATDDTGVIVKTSFSF